MHRWINEIETAAHSGLEWRTTTRASQRFERRVFPFKSTRKRRGNLRFCVGADVYVKHKSSNTPIDRRTLRKIEERCLLRRRAGRGRREIKNTQTLIPPRALRSFKISWKLFFSFFPRPTPKSRIESKTFRREDFSAWRRLELRSCEHSREGREKSLNGGVSRAAKTLSSRFLCFRWVRDSHVLEAIPSSHRTERMPSEINAWTHVFRIAWGINFSFDDRKQPFWRPQVRCCLCFAFSGFEEIANSQQKITSGRVDVSKRIKSFSVFFIESIRQSIILGKFNNQLCSLWWKRIDSPLVDCQPKVGLTKR